MVRLACRVPLLYRAVPCSVLPEDSNVGWHLPVAFSSLVPTNPNVETNLIVVGRRSSIVAVIAVDLPGNQPPTKGNTARTHARTRGRTAHALTDACANPTGIEGTTTTSTVVEKCPLLYRKTDLLKGDRHHVL